MQLCRTYNMYRTVYQVMEAGKVMICTTAIVGQDVGTFHTALTPPEGLVLLYYG